MAICVPSSAPTGGMEDIPSGSELLLDVFPALWSGRADQTLFLVYVFFNEVEYCRVHPEKMLRLPRISVCIKAVRRLYNILCLLFERSMA